MAHWRFKLLYFLLLPAIVGAGGILGYYTFQTAAQFERLGERSIARSILTLVEDKVNRLENQIIEADNRVFATIDPTDPDTPARSWKPQAEELSPSVRAVIVLDSSHEVVAYAARASSKEARSFLRLFVKHIVPDLELDKLPDYRLKHLHTTYRGSNYLISYKAVTRQQERYYLVAHHDTGHLVRDVFPELFASDSGTPDHNVVDEHNRRIFGPSLAKAGDYVVSRGFPTTLYNWRLQVAPKEAPLLKAKGRTRLVNQVALISLAFVIVLLGILFLLYAAHKERRLNVLKSDFIANVSHELKTPLSVIRMFAEMLLTRRVPSGARQQQYLEMICSESERLTGLIENVLDFAALEQGKRRYEMRECDLIGLIERAIDTFRYRFETEGAQLRFSKDESEVRVQVDEQALLLAVINLLDNALKYGNAGPVEVALEVEGQDVHLGVRDHGPGIPAEDLRRIFERFYRTRRESKVRGSGIGLALVRYIAEDHGGRAWARNAPDGGAIVGITLPRAKSATELPEPSLRESAA